MSVKVDGVVEIPRHQWYQLIDIFTRVDEQLEVLIKQIDYTNKLLEGIAKSLGAAVRPPTEAILAPPAPAVTTVEEVLNNRYKVFKLDLSVARNNEPLGLRDMGIVAKSAVVTRLDSPASWRRNDPTTGEPEELYTGYRVDNFAIEELYITNDVGTGYLTIVVEWRE
ncbi:MAG: hypothetical protein MRT15_04285 [archaeon YNP-LCB-003-016]|uniref:hypothetical protein n=1 Tax=Candidatus Culexarchaeum yellowstonense TaxID=2928963 RepID=UPI0026EAAB54|nr:hypothetical protein [Candidatus Culexarchaeum yellowstonense]MCR6691587.1 hypothetical protein [Candidatus Culexarchaeum yellowstonense]